MYVKIEQKLSKGFNSWKTMMLANGEKLKKYGMTVAVSYTHLTLPTILLV